MTYDHVQAVKNIPPDEPIFIVRAQDKYAQDLIMHWQVMNIEHGTLKVLCPEDKRKSAEVVLQAIADWQRENPDKVKQPD